MLFNPFPGLRPFEADEDHLFFGRESEIDDLLRRLRTTRFLALVGTSGSGKSSLVRSGLIPALQSGFMSGASSSWRIAVMRPGEDPIGHLAAAVSSPDMLGVPDTELASTNAALTEATLRRGPLGLADAFRQAHLPADENVLIIVDQFEELFRFRRSRHENSHDEAIAFVRLLLEAARQPDLRLYVALTMRSDFIGDCMDFPGLPATVNAGLYLVGRMSREALRKAIVGPVAVGGGAIAPRLVNRILNDLGDDQDQLPLVQHALMRTWDHWARRAEAGVPIDVDDYEAIGTFATALSRHAEEAYQEAAAEGHGRLAERLFKALTDTFSDARGVRRPTSVAELAAICEAPESTVIAVVEIFRRPGRSFLMPPASVALQSRSIVDLSHESLMRCWTRLIAWAGEERAAAAFYIRLSQAAAWFETGSGGLWRNPEVELADRWRAESQPTAAWASRYHEGFEGAIAFLDRSLEAIHREQAALERQRRSKLRRAEMTAGALALLLVAAAAFGYLAWRERTRAEGNLVLARQAVDESLSSVDRDPARVGADLPAVEELRRELLQKAGAFYAAFLTQAPHDEPSQRDAAFGHFRLGQINRLTDKPDAAAQEYRLAIAGFARLATRYPAKAEYRQALANAYNWLGETLRPDASKSGDAAAAYDEALRRQETLVKEDPANRQYPEELARSHYNRGILRAGLPTGAAASEADFRDAIRLLEPLAGSGDRAAQELARSDNNLGSLLSGDPAAAGEVQALWEKAIAIDERLSTTDPSNREYQIELATYCSNLAALLNQRGQDVEAERRIRESVDLIEQLARVAPSLAIARADAHDLRGMILASRDPKAAETEYATAIDLFDRGRGDGSLLKSPEFNQRLADLVQNLVMFRTAPDLLARAVSVYADVSNGIAASGSIAEARGAFDNLSRVLPQVPEPDRDRLAAAQGKLQLRIGGR